MTVDFFLKLLDKGFSVAVAVICLLIMWKALPILAQIKMVMLATTEYQHNNNKIIENTTEIIRDNTQALKENREILNEVRNKL
jgi:hypothetical protein